MKRTSVLVLIFAVAMVAASVAAGVRASSASAATFCLGAACPASTQGIVPSSGLGNVHCPAGTTEIAFNFADGDFGTQQTYTIGLLSGTVTAGFDDSSIPSGKFTVTGGAVAVQANLHGGAGSGGTNATNMYDYSGFAAGGVTSDGNLRWPGPVSNIFVCLVPPIPLAVSTHSFRAVRSGRAVTLRWRTASEQNTLGFKVYRKAHGKLVKLTKRMIPAASLSHSSASHSYSFRARLTSRKLAATSRYVLAEVHLNGTRTLYGPVRATAAS